MFHENTMGWIDSALHMDSGMQMTKIGDKYEEIVSLSHHVLNWQIGASVNNFRTYYILQEDTQVLLKVPVMLLFLVMPLFFNSLTTVLTFSRYMKKAESRDCMVSWW